mmetsp:Transcript_12894/g.26131  ORF Transcript_12894/g.26131 Transcript_12894/m.26131 type:complete len:99 (+) Transcript_12894:1702-1998(+)
MHSTGHLQADCGRHFILDGDLPESVDLEGMGSTYSFRTQTRFTTRPERDRLTEMLLKCIGKATFDLVPNKTFGGESVGEGCAGIENAYLSNEVEGISI